MRVPPLEVSLRTVNAYPRASHQRVRPSRREVEMSFGAKSERMSARANHREVREKLECPSEQYASACPCRSQRMVQHARELLPLC